MEYRAFKVHFAIEKHCGYPGDDVERFSCEVVNADAYSITVEGALKLWKGQSKKELVVVYAPRRWTKIEPIE